MSTVRCEFIEKDTPQHGATDALVLNRPRAIAKFLWAAILCVAFFLPTTTLLAGETHPINQEQLLTTINEFAQAVGKADRVAAGQRDFVCLLKMAQQQLFVDGNFPDALSPIYEWCAQRRTQAHGRVLSQQDRGLDNIWPGPGLLVDFNDFQRFYISETRSKQLAPSFFVMYDIARHEPENPFTLEALEFGALPHASFPSADESKVLAAPTSFVTTTVTYPNPLTAPVSNAPGMADWVVPYKKAHSVVQSVKVKWVVLSDLKQLGFPIDQAVLDLPLEGPHGTTIPFVMDAGGYVPRSTQWFGPEGQDQAAQRGIEQAQAASTSLESLMILNRIVMIAPNNQQVLNVFANQLYQGILDLGSRLHGIRLGDDRLARRFNELYWTVKSQTDRFDLALSMEAGGKAEPTPADYLYRMVPVMEALASLEPGNFTNRLHLISAYRWNNDQMAALSAPQELLAEVPEEQEEMRAEALLQLAWARIGKVAWSRHFDDPDIRKGYDTAKRALDLTKDPWNKFMAAYAMAYSLAFQVPRDDQAMVELLQQAKDWHGKIHGSSPQSWAYMLQNDTFKGLVKTNPAFQSLLAVQ